MSWNPFTLRKKVEDLEVALAFVKNSLAIEKQTAEEKIEALKKNNSRWRDEAEEKTKALREAEEKIKALREAEEAADILNTLLEEKVVELKQLRADKEVLEKRNADLERKNKLWFETFLGYGVDDFTLLSKGLWGEVVKLVSLGESR